MQNLSVLLTTESLKTQNYIFDITSVKFLFSKWVKCTCSSERIE